MSKGRPVGIQRCGRAANSIVASLALAACFLAGASAGGAAPTRDPNEGPGGPILVVADPGNPFSRYYAEILRTEGLNAFAVANIAAGRRPAARRPRTSSSWASMALDAAQVALLADWVSAGGKLIAMRPDADLAALLGLGSSAARLSDAYLRIDTAAGPGAGLVAETIQFHGTADLLPLAGATCTSPRSTRMPPHATAYPGRDPCAPVGAPAVEAAAFTYDLARSVVAHPPGQSRLVRDGPRR